MAIILAALAWLLTYLLHSTILLGGAFVLAGLGLVRSHAGRDTLWKVALIGGVVTATAQLALRLQPAAGHVALAARPELGLVDVAGVRDVAPVALPAGVESSAAVKFARDITPADEAPAAASPGAPVRTTRPLFSGLHISWPAMLLNLWFVGAFGFALRLLWLRVSLRRGLRTRAPVTSGPLFDALADLSRAAGVAMPRLSVSDQVPGPIAFGREICVPERVLSCLTAGEQRAVLAHELGHVVRRDPAWLMVTAIIQHVLFIQPLNRLARRQLRAESEYLCDDWAAERTGGVVLARCLAEVAGWVQGHPSPAVVAGMAGHCSQLVSRVERLLDGSTGARPARWFVRAAAGAGILTLIACSVPGVAAEDLGRDAAARGGESEDQEFPYAGAEGDGWGAVRDGGRLIVLSAGYGARLTGSGHLGFQQWNRGIVIPDGYVLRVGGEDVEDDRDLCDETRGVRIVALDGSGSWEVTPVRREGALAYADQGHKAFARQVRDQVRAELERARGELDRAREDLRRDLAADAHADADAATDAAMDGEADAAIDTLVQLWVRDPEAVRRAARRIARTYDRELRPQFESLGVEVGRELAPQLQRLSDRLGRDLTPEFARLGAALGASILSDLAAEAGDRPIHDRRDKSNKR